MKPVEPETPRALPDGSPLWWALLFTPADRRPAVRALLAVRGELVETSRRSSEPAVAAAKLGWWRDEVRRFGSGTEQHPATRALAASPGGDAVEPEYLEELVDAAEMDAFHRPYGGYSELRLYCHRSTGVLHEMMACIAGGRPGGDERGMRRAAHGVGVGLRLAEIACRFPADLREGRLYLPGDWLDEAGIDDAALAAGTPGPPLQACLARLAEAARQELADGLAACPARARARYPGGEVIAALARRRLDAAEARGWTAEPGRSRVAAARTTFTDLLTAWRAARRATEKR